VVGLLVLVLWCLCLWMKALQMRMLLRVLLEVYQDQSQGQWLDPVFGECVPKRSTTRDWFYKYVRVPGVWSGSRCMLLRGGDGWRGFRCGTRLCLVLIGMGVEFVEGFLSGEMVLQGLGYWGLRSGLLDLKGRR